MAITAWKTSHYLFILAFDLNRNSK